MVRLEPLDDLDDFTAAVGGGPPDVEFAGWPDTSGLFGGFGRPWRERVGVKVQGGEGILKSGRGPRERDAFVRRARHGLHEVCGDFCHGAAFALEEVDMGHELLTLQAVARVDEAVGVGVDVGIVNLGEIANQDHFGAFSHAGDQRFGFVRGELLGFIHDEDGAGNGASANMGDGFDFDKTCLDERFVGAAWFCSGPRVCRC